jgi:hypothetical protein
MRLKKRLDAKTGKELSKIDASMTCSACGGGEVLCAKGNRNYIIGFPAHGALESKFDDAMYDAGLKANPPR